jgi:hypothetical protein
MLIGGRLALQCGVNGMSDDALVVATISVLKPLMSCKPSKDWDKKVCEVGRVLGSGPGFALL